MLCERSSFSKAPSVNICPGQWTIFLFPSELVLKSIKLNRFFFFIFRVMLLVLPSVLWKFKVMGVCLLPPSRCVIHLCIFIKSMAHFKVT